jgi:hypothetical protein
MILASILLLSQQMTTVEPFALPEHLAAIQLDETNRLHLVAIRGQHLRLLESGLTIDFPGQSTLFTIVDYDGDGYEELWSLSDGKSLQKLYLVKNEIDGDKLAFGASIIKGIKAIPPTGFHAAKFMQDFNADGLLDLFLPVSDRVQVHINSNDGFLDAIKLGTLSQLRVSNGNDLLSSVGRIISVPGLLPEDISGDGLPDLVVSDGGLVRQYVATEAGFPVVATSTLDTSDYAKDTGEYELDFSNLSKGAAYIVQNKWADLDGDGDRDVMILADSKVIIFLGDADGINTAKEHQRLGVSGNVVYLFPARIDGDDVPDLVIVRVEDISIGKLLRAVLMSFEIELYFLAFRGLGDGKFDIRAMRKKTAKLHADSLKEIIGEGREELSKMRKRVIRTCAISDDSQRNDILILEADGLLNLYSNVITGPNVLHDAIEKFLQQNLGKKKGDLDLELNSLLEWMLGRTSAMASLTKGVKPMMSVTLKDWETPHAMLVRDFDGDGLDEALILRQHTNEAKEKVLSGVTVDFN